MSDQKKPGKWILAVVLVVVAIGIYLSMWYRISHYGTGAIQ